MSEHKKLTPTRVELPSWLTEFYERALQKDLQEHEGVCPHCHGLGWEVTDQAYGISDDPYRSHSTRFPYHNQYIIPCRHCYTGVICYCEHCGKELPKGRLKCDCAAVKRKDKVKELQKEIEHLAKAEKFQADALGNRFNMCYSEYYRHNEGYFSDWEEFFEEWYDFVRGEHDGTEPERPKYVWGTDKTMIGVDVDDVVERATEDLWEGACDQISREDVAELQKCIDEWCARQLGTKTYTWTYKYAVKIPWNE